MLLLQNPSYFHGPILTYFFLIESFLLPCSSRHSGSPLKSTYCCFGYEYFSLHPNRSVFTWFSFLCSLSSCIVLVSPRFVGLQSTRRSFVGAYTEESYSSLWLWNGTTHSRVSCISSKNGLFVDWNSSSRPSMWLYYWWYWLFHWSPWHHEEEVYLECLWLSA